MNKIEAINKFIARGNEILNKAATGSSEGMYDGYSFHSVSGEEFEKWKNDVKLFTLRYLNKHPLHDEIIEEMNRDKDNWHESDTVLINNIAKLKSVSEDDVFWSEITMATEGMEMCNQNDVFIVHGHTKVVDTVSLTVRKLGLNPIVLREQPNKGRTIITKLGDYGSKAGYAIVIYSPNDIMENGNKRARQNVVLEHGYFIGKLGYEKIFVLLETDEVEQPGIEKPGDIDGVVYTQMGKGWEFELVRELKAVGYDVSADRLI